MSSCIKNPSFKVAAVVVGLSVLMGGSLSPGRFSRRPNPIGRGRFHRPHASWLSWDRVQFVVNDTVEVGVANYPTVVSFNLEVTDNTITFTYTEFDFFNTASFNGYILTAISPGIPAFGSITVDPATTLAGFNSSDLGLDSKDFYVNVSGLEAFPARC